MFQPIYRYCEKIGNSVHTSAWKSKGLSEERIKPPATSDDTLAPSSNYIDVRPRIKFDGQCLKQHKVTFTYKDLLNIYIAYETNLWAYKQNDNFVFGSSLFGAVNLTKNADFDKNKYFGYCII